MILWTDQSVYDRIIESQLRYVLANERHQIAFLSDVLQDKVRQYG